MTGDYAQTTEGIVVSVRSFFLADQSRPEEGEYVWAYRIRIVNGSRETVQLLRRTWLITDARGRVQRVHGEGVVGEQPVLEPGEAFEYRSGTKMPTPSGIMVGSYRMEDRNSGELFEVAIPAFSLDSPHQAAVLH